VPKVIYPSYEEALKDCLNPLGYEEDDVVKVVLEKTKAFKIKLDDQEFFDMDATTSYAMFVINKCLQDSEFLNVVDFGGACGAHYFTFRKLLPSKVVLNWIVVETTNMVKYAKELESESLKFVDSLEVAQIQLGTINLLFSSGTIQSVEQPLKTLKALIDLKAEYMFLTRLSLNTNPKTLIVKQQTLLSENGIGPLPDSFTDRLIEYPHTNVPEQEFLETLKADYKVLIKFNDTSGIHRVKDESITGYGLLLHRKIN
jgi:putative methyltransferase (TIGR04325 family)